MGQGDKRESMMAEAAITVAVEKAVHDAMREVMQNAWDQHQVCVQSVRATWMDASTAGQNRLVVCDIEMETLTKRER